MEVATLRDDVKMMTNQINVQKTQNITDPFKFQSHLKTMSKNNSFTRIFQQLSSVISHSKTNLYKPQNKFLITCGWHDDSSAGGQSVTFLGKK